MSNGFSSFGRDLDLQSETRANNATGKVEDDHAKDSAAGRDQLASPSGGRDVAVANAVESDEGPPRQACLSHCYLDFKNRGKAMLSRPTITRPPCL